MLEKLCVPRWYCPNLYDINLDELSDSNISYLFFDLDNTLLPYYEKFASAKLTEYLQKIRDRGFKIFVISNNNRSRVAPFADQLQLKYLNSAFKPFKFRIKKLLKREGITRDQVVLIGDQLLTDIIVARRLKIASILVEPAVKGDLKKTKINRFFDRKLRKKMIDKNLVRYFKEISDE